MLAFIYLILMCVLGDTICRRFFVYVSTPHRYATAFISGLLISSWWTYLTALLFAGTASPMLWGNVIFFVTSIALILWLRSRPAADVSDAGERQAAAQFETWDWVLIGIFLLFTSWMMFSTFNVTDGIFKIGHHQFPDFGSTVSIMQSFAEGRNFPTEYPHFSGDRIRYHFLFYFQAGNLEYLGLDAALSNNILSVLSMTSMLALVMTLGRVLFDSRVIGRIGAALFFFHGSLAFIPFVYAQNSFGDLLTKLSTMTMFLNSGLPHRGEDWGVWSQNVYLNQRHLTSSIGILLIIMIFLIVRYSRFKAEAAAGAVLDELGDSPDTGDNGEGSDDVSERSVITSAAVSADSSAQADEVAVEADPDSEHDVDSDEEDEDGDQDEGVDGDESEDEDDADNVVRRSPSKAGKFFSSDAWWGPPLTNPASYVLMGVLLGLTPMWNGAIFTTAFFVLAILFVLFPLKRQMLVLGVTTAVFAIPQIMFLKMGARPTGYSYFHWGYTIENASLYDALYYLFFTFGFKWFLIAIALYFADGVARRVFIAISGLIVVAFCFRFSEELLVNHKFFNVWLVIANLFVAYGIVKLWRTEVAGSRVLTRVLALVLAFLSVIGGVIDLMPIKNSYFVEMKHDGDKLVEWVKTTDPAAIFLSHRYINHQILLAGRRLFYGEPYYPWGAGYDTNTRDAVYRRMFESTDPQEVFNLLKENKISYVAVDDMIRGGRNFIKNSNEAIFKAYFKVVFEDTDRQYANLKVYAVPDSLGSPDPNVDLKGGTPTPEPTGAPSVDVFTGGVGSGNGQSVVPRGIVTDDKGNIFVTDTGNGRIQKFDASGKFITAFGKNGTGEGEIKEPNGIAVDDAGEIYVTDAANHKLVKFAADGKFVKEWKPDGGFYGPRDIVFGPNKKLYIIDQGLTRIARFDPATESFTVWGSNGSNPGQFIESTGIAIGGNELYVADTGNQRIQVFDLDGNFIRQWTVTAWDPKTLHFPDIVFDNVDKRVYATGGSSNLLLAFDPDGGPVAGFPGEGTTQLENPSSITIASSPSPRRLLILNTGSAKVTAVDLGAKKAK